MKKLRKGIDRLFADLKEYGWAGVVFLVYYAIVHLFRASFCPMLNLTGIPCAGCGLTRTFLYLVTGQVKRAVYMNPMAFLIIVFLLYCGYFRYIKGTKIKGFRVIFALLIAAMLVFYAVRMYLYFPDRVPYVYKRDNVLANRVPGYQSLIDRLLQMIRASRR
ncbi:MAG: DUF2752 domain-containing protein [Suilimivivens sp.]